MVISQWPVQIEYNHQACLPTIGDRTPTQDIGPDLLLGTVTGTGIKIAGQSHNHTCKDIAVIVTITHTGVTPGHITDATTEVLHNVTTPAHTVTIMTRHTRDYPHIEVP